MSIVIVPPSEPTVEVEVDRDHERRVVYFASGAVTVSVDDPPAGGMALITVAAPIELLSAFQAILSNPAMVALLAAATQPPAASPPVA